MRILVRVRPGARRDAVGGRWDVPRGPALVVAVRARAVEGAANEAVLAAVAAAFRVRVSAVSLTTGARGRDKILDVIGDDRALAERLAMLMDVRPP